MIFQILNENGRDIAIPCERASVELERQTHVRNWQDLRGHHNVARDSLSLAPMSTSSVHLVCDVELNVAQKAKRKEESLKQGMTCEERQQPRMNHVGTLPGLCGLC